MNDELLTLGAIDWSHNPPFSREQVRVLLSVLTEVLSAAGADVTFNGSDGEHAEMIFTGANGWRVSVTMAGAEIIVKRRMLEVSQ